MKYVYNDGGRNDAGYVGSTGDCATRAVAIVMGTKYQDVYDSINEYAQAERTGKRKRGRSNARTGVYRGTLHKLMIANGWEWVPTMFIGQGCKTHLKADELPGGRLLVSVSKHYTAVIDGVINDTSDPSRGETRCVYGYYKRPE